MVKYIAAYLHVHWNDVKKIQENISSNGFNKVLVNVVKHVQTIIHLNIKYHTDNSGMLH